MKPFLLQTVPAAILYRKTHAVPHIDRQIAQICKRMIVTVEKADGLGLAAPQVGHLHRLFVIRLPNQKPQVFINPQIVSRSDRSDSYQEGCLSIPGVYADVQRPVAVDIKAWDERGRAFRWDYEVTDGLLARVIQHEYDHLDGVLFWDHLSQRRREQLHAHYVSLQQSAATAEQSSSQSSSQSSP